MNEIPNTAMGKAFARAGFVSVEVRLRELLRETVAAHGVECYAEFRAAISARPDAIELLWVLFERHYPVAFRELLAAVRDRELASDAAREEAPKGQTPDAASEANPIAPGEAVRQVPKGQGLAASSGAIPVPRPSRLRYGAQDDIGRRQLSGFYIHERNGERTPIELIPVASIKQRRRWAQRHGAALQFEAAVLAELERRLPAYSPEGSTVGDVYSRDEIVAAVEAPKRRMLSGPAAPAAA